MRNRFLNIFFIMLLSNIITSFSNSNEQITLDVTEIEILDNGKIIKGLNYGKAVTENGIEIKAKEFLYSKENNVLRASGNVKVFDRNKNIEIYSNEILYEKNDEVITANNDVKVFDHNKNIEIYSNEIVYEKNDEVITANNDVKVFDHNKNIEIYSNEIVYEKNDEVITANNDVKVFDRNKNIEIYSNEIVYEKNDEVITAIDNSRIIYNVNQSISAYLLNFNISKNILHAEGNVKAKNKSNNTRIEAEEITYFKFEEKMITKGDTYLDINNEYYINSKNLIYLVDENQISSENKSKISDKNNRVYHLNEFKYSIYEKVLRGKDLLLITNNNLPKSDKFFFSSAIIDIKNQNFSAKDVEINIHKNVFGNNTNDPRLKGVSAKGNNENIQVNKGVFTSCNRDNKCPPWSMKAKKINHDKNKKQLNYEDAVLNIYDIPILYFPKFFHPDPTVKRQSGFLKPELNNSSILGSSITIPYFKVISDNKDLTIKPSLFDNNTKIAQLEYRQQNKNSYAIADVGFVNNFKSKTTKKNKNLNHFFGKFKLDLDLTNFQTSELTGTLEKVSNDKYLKIFENFITSSELRPDNFNKLENNIKLNLISDKYNFETGITTYETLDGSSEDKFQYILPYYNFEKLLQNNFYDGSIIFSSTGSNDLNSTNKLDTSIINNLSYESKEYFTDTGFKSNIKIDLKNSNVVGKNSSKYKSSPQAELVSLINAEVSLPLSKKNELTSNILVPKLSLRFNPTDMKNYSASENKVDVDNIFLNNRLGLTDTYEAGKSLTLGLDYKKEIKNNLDDINKYFELKLATVFRDKEEKSIPKKSTLNRKSSNIFGSISNKFSNNVELNYEFSVDNDYSTFEYNDLNLKLSSNNIVTSFNFIEERGEIGNTNLFESSLGYNFNDRNSLTFSSRRNRKLNLTEYYDLVYEYKYDCLTAGIKYKKNYYSDGDLKPSENLFFTVTLFPLTNYEYDAKDLLKN